MYHPEPFDKVIHPEKYLADLISTNLRPDSRPFHSFRPIIINVRSISTAESSAMVRLGNTTAICGIKAELAVPKAEEPNLGYVITNVEMPPLCTPKLRPGPPSDVVQFVNNMVSDIILGSKCVDLVKLCIAPEKLSWVLYCDITCLDNDGSVVDACVAAVLASIKTLSLPKVTYDIETEEINIDESEKYDVNLENMPITTSFALYNKNILLVDPSSFEEDLCGGSGANLVISSNGEDLSCVQKFGSSAITDEKQEQALKIAQKRAFVMIEALEKAVASSDSAFQRET